jgi:omega-amidase
LIRVAGWWYSVLPFRGAVTFFRRNRVPLQDGKYRPTWSWNAFMSITIACAFDDLGLTAFESENVAGSVDILVLPELFDGGYKRLHQDKGPSASVAQMADRFSRISRNHQMHFVAGTVAWKNTDGKVRNTSLVYSKGELVTEVAKTHLFRPLGDDQFFAHGSPMTPLTLDCGGEKVRTGIIVCYDLRFPEIVRPWFKRGIDLLIVPARWPSVRDDIWRLLLQARAVENQCFVVGVDARDDEGGGSYAFAPDGRALFELAPATGANSTTWRKFEIDLSDISRVKERLDTRGDARLL